MSYAFYHDVIRRGHYMWEIEEMHRQYGPIVRISPDTVHVNDPEFIDQIFAGPGKKPLNPFFSKQNIRRLETTVLEVLDRIIQRLDEHVIKKVPVNLSLLYRATTHDIIAKYAFGEDSVCFNRQDLNKPYFESYHKMASIVKINKIKSSTIHNEENDLPESEKSPARLAEEAQNLLAAGTDSTANTLSAITYHLLSNPHILKKLRAELQDAIPEGTVPKISKIENLPYLSAVIQEGLRLRPAVSTRQERVSPDEDLIYTNGKTKMSYRIPAGTCMATSAVLPSRLPEIYPSPEEFRPERFLENATLKRHQLTFSCGTRVCLGINLAYQEMYMILATLFRRCDPWDGTGDQTSMTLELFETTHDDIAIVRDLVTENIKDDSQGVRVTMRDPSISQVDE
ncbi:cytochrome P450 [Talaromyces proteolyticus]|uniref:Cytochrome P450 n=1 Tax=Talaromyces proteolyticus TaxID=1131652 RepID=A0AAD4KY78_9EURO|nr:cytochrome P450 [Talaromyces proteolyticus]KAH8703117.1 cytochrome P450 [Talaromyces proteolyticus]